MSQPGWKRGAKIALKGVLAALVLWAVGRHVARTWRDLREHGETLRVEPAWIALAVLLYLAGLSACGAFFARVLRAGPTPIGTLPALRAYLISHLGKYVPGKAMVVLMRVGLVTPYGARPATAALATLYETLDMMAAGGLVAAIGFALPPSQWWASALGAGMGLGLLLVVDPLVFPRLSRLMTLPFPGVGPEALPRVTRRLMGEGLLWSSAGWALLGLSLVAVVRAISDGEGVPLVVWPALIGGVALATVAGFAVAVLPGGLGVREGVLMTALTPSLGADRAVIAALALRLTWVFGEVLAAAALAAIRPPLPLPAPDPTPSPAASPTSDPTAICP
jgi:glycosyltransferase 2 family protein